MHIILGLLLFQLSGLIVQSGKTYATLPIAEGAAMYIDRSYKFGPVPAIFTARTMIRTANDDKAFSSGAPLIVFKVDQDSLVYILYSNSQSSLEETWLTTANGWAMDSFTIPSDILENSGIRLVRHKAFTKDSLVVLPGAGALGSMYNVVIVPAAIPPQTELLSAISWDLCGDFVVTGAFEAVKAELFVDDIAVPVNTWAAPPGSTFNYPVSMCRTLPADFKGRSYTLRVVFTNIAGVQKTQVVTFP